MKSKSTGARRASLGVIALAVCCVVSPASAEKQQLQAEVHAQVQSGIWTVINNPSLPEGVTITVDQVTRFDATAYCQADGYRVTRLGEETYGADKAVLRAVVRAGSTVVGNNDALGAAADARAACERGDGSMLTQKLKIAVGCKQVKTVLIPDIVRKGYDMFPTAVVQVKCQGFAKPQDKTPLWLAWSASAQDNDSAPTAFPRGGDWVYVRIQGDMWKAQAPGTIALKKWRRIDGTGDMLYTTKPPPAGYKDFGTLGYIYDPAKPPPPGTVALMRYYSSARKDYFLNERPEFNPTAEGYGAGVLEGYVFKRF